MLVSKAEMNRFLSQIPAPRSAVALFVGSLAGQPAIVACEPPPEEEAAPPAAGARPGLEVFLDEDGRPRAPLPGERAPTTIRPEAPLEVDRRPDGSVLLKVPPGARPSGRAGEPDSRGR